MKDLVILREELPILESNFEEVKADLSKRLEEFRLLVVTEDSLKLCKEHQRDLSSLRKKIDNYRKDIKKKFTAPITAFEFNCKELIGLVEDTEAPLKNGIKVYDDLVREQKKLFAVMEISKQVNELGLNNKYGSQLLVLDNYTNLTAKKKDVSADIQQRALLLLEQQKRELELFEVLQDAIEKANKTITQKLVIADIKHEINNQMSTKDLVNLIEKKALKIFNSEQEVIKATEIKVIEDAKPIEEPKKETIINEKMYTYNMDITGTKDSLNLLKEFLESNNIKFNVLPARN